MRRTIWRLAAGAAFGALLVFSAVSLHAPARNFLTHASTPAADPIINLTRWEEADGGNGHWYGVLAEEHTWLEAESLAATYLWESQAGYLATIRDSAENAFILDQILLGADPPTNRDQFFLGGRLMAWDWHWITGEQLCYVNWAYGEPRYLPLDRAVSIWGHTSYAWPVPGGWNSTFNDASVRHWAVVEWGPFDTTVQIQECGNGTVECAESCDDGNTSDGDGCNSHCRQEYWPCGYVLGGDANVDGKVTAADVIFEIQWFYKSGPPPEPCVAFGDIDCSGAFTAGDVIALVNYIFKAGPAPCDPCNSPMAVECEL